VPEKAAFALLPPTAIPLSPRVRVRRPQVNQ